MNLKLYLIFCICVNSFSVTKGLVFVYTTYGLQVYLDRSNYENDEPHYIHSTHSFGFIEASRICESEYFSNSTLLSYETVYLPAGDAINSTAIDLECPSNRSVLRECVSNIITPVEKVVNVTCRDAPGDGQLIQLADGAVAISTRARGVLTWGHVCHKDSNWDVTAAGLACARLGYRFVELYKIKVEKKGVLGLYDFSCENAVLFNQCTFKISSNTNGRCNTSYVIAIKCCQDDESDCTSISPNTNSPVVVDTKSTTYSVSTPPTVSVSRPSSPVTYTSPPPHPRNSWVFIGAGVAAGWLVIIASGFVISLCIVCCCCRSDVIRKKKGLQANLSQMLYANPNIPGTLRAREEQDPPLQSYYILT